MRKYTHVFIDLDRTLWDFDTNVAETLREMLHAFSIDQEKVSADLWIERYRTINKELWHNFEQKTISKTKLRVERFQKLLEYFNIEKEFQAEDLSDFFLKMSPDKSGLMPGVVDILEYLSLNYKLAIITNGFVDVQLRKLKAGGIDGYFDKVFTSDIYKIAKPDKRLFQEALKSMNARKKLSVMIGDSYEKDVLGAKTVGIDQVWYNHDEKKASGFKPTHEIKTLNEIKTIL